MFGASFRLGRCTRVNEPIFVCVQFIPKQPLDEDNARPVRCTGNVSRARTEASAGDTYLYAVLPALPDKDVLQLVVDGLHAARHSADEGFGHRHDGQRRGGSSLHLGGESDQTKRKPESRKRASEGHALISQPEIFKFIM